MSYPLSLLLVGVTLQRKNLPPSGSKCFILLVVNFKEGLLCGEMDTTFIKLIC